MKTSKKINMTTINNKYSTKLASIVAESSPEGIDSILTKLKICFSAKTHNVKSLSESKQSWQLTHLSCQEVLLKDLFAAQHVFIMRK